jgi:hypothetical protein
MIDQFHTDDPAMGPEGGFTTQDGSDRIAYGRVVVLRFVLPEPEDAPPLIEERASLPTVAFEIGAELVAPELLLRPRADIVLRAAMPETAVDKDDHVLAREYEVWSSSWRSQSNAVPQSPLPENAPDSHLWRRLRLANGCHLLGARHSHGRQPRYTRT